MYRDTKKTVRIFFFEINGSGCSVVTDGVARPLATFPQNPDVGYLSISCDGNVSQRVKSRPANEVEPSEDIIRRPNRSDCKDNSQGS